VEVLEPTSQTILVLMVVLAEGMAEHLVMVLVVVRLHKEHQ
jgi:hypothetical protein